MTVIVVGAGISGLTAAYRLMRRGVDVRLCEADKEAGGCIRTKETDGCIVEEGPNSLLTSPEVDELVRDLGLEDELVEGDPRAPRYIVRDGAPVCLVPGPGALLAPILSFRAKLRLLGDLVLPSPEELEDESVEEFFTRRFGREVATYLAGPFVSGIYAGDPRATSVRSAFPKLFAAERLRKGVIRGLMSLREKKPAPRRRTASFRKGLGTLTDALAVRLEGRLDTGVQVSRLAPGASTGFRVEFAGGDTRQADAVLLAVSAGATSSMLESDYAAAAEALKGIQRVPVVSVSFLYPESAFRKVPEGFGVLIPRCEGIRPLGCLYISSLFPGRAPAGEALFTAYLGGALDAGALDLTDDEIAALVERDLAPLLGASGKSRIVQVSRIEKAIPQYRIGHHEKTEQALSNLPSGLILAGNWLGGVSIADCIAYATKAQAAI